MDEVTPLGLAMVELQQKTAAVAEAKAAIGTVTAEADRVRKATIRAAHEKLTAAKSALEEASKAFKREVGSATKP